PQPAPKPTPQPGPKPAQEQSNISKKPSNNNISELPKTGDASIMGFVGALLLSVGGLLINDRK
ncbi:MAG: LPXTG cell wall anchor domain-containing protein, partial [Clostridium sp.]